jgi:hypothetical protein
MTSLGMGIVEMANIEDDTISQKAMKTMIRWYSVLLLDFSMMYMIVADEKNESVPLHDCSTDAVLVK